MLTKAEHAAYIASPEWRRRRDRHLNAYGRRCRACGTNRTIQVHHLTYERAYEGQELDQDLMVLCDSHHGLAHAFEASGLYGGFAQDGTLERSTRAMLDYVKHPPPDPHPRPMPFWKAWLYRNWLTLTGRKYE